MSALVLVVEDDPAIGSGLCRALRATGYDAPWAQTAAEARRLVAADPPDLVLMDLGLPDEDGLDLCIALQREQPDLPVIMLTARAEEMDIVVGLDGGAVDYITKPFRLAELLARVHAQLRQREHRHRVGDAAALTTLQVGDLEIDLGAHRVLLCGTEVALRPREFDLIARLARDAGQVVTRETLMHDVWDEHWWGSTKTLDVHLNALRRKLGEQPGEPSRVTAIRGVGYRLERVRPEPR
ncbi:MAG: response regulator transcription factor [Acidimicrobiales bacterium]|nr:response regulator transcription factor [Acidimicrobiales bacterium]